MPTAIRVASDPASRSGLGQSEMSLIGETSRDAAPKTEAGVEANPTFQFVPRELAAKSRKLIESYHALHGFGCLPDLLWHWERATSSSAILTSRKSSGTPASLAAPNVPTICSCSLLLLSSRSRRWRAISPAGANGFQPRSRRQRSCSAKRRPHHMSGSWICICTHRLVFTVNAPMTSRPLGDRNTEPRAPSRHQCNTGTETQAPARWNFCAAAVTAI